MKKPGGGRKAEAERALPVRERRRLPRRESAAARAERATRIAGLLAEAYPEADCELVHDGPWQLLVATILSAQCTDKMVNQVTPGLFAAYPDPAALARAPQADVEERIRRTGFFAQKAKAIRACAARVVEAFGGQVPRDMESLTSLQGVGRKTASVVLGTAFGEPAVFVDTHVNRLTNRLGLSRSSDPARIEVEIKGMIQPSGWTSFCHRLIHHGRRICTARSPKCDLCPLLEACPQIGVAR